MVDKGHSVHFGFVGRQIKAAKSRRARLALRGSFPDAAYLAVSQTRHIPLLTADYKLLAKLKGFPLVMSLREIKL